MPQPTFSAVRFPASAGMVTCCLSFLEAWRVHPVEVTPVCVVVAARAKMKPQIFTRPEAKRRTAQKPYIACLLKLVGLKKWVRVTTNP